MAASNAPGVRLTVLGRLAAHTPAGTLSGPALGSRKGRQVLLLLATTRGRALSVDTIVDLLWDDVAPANARRGVASLVSRLRRTLGRDVIEGDATGYRLGPSVSVDLDEARALLQEAGERLADGETGLAAAAAQRAVELLAREPTHEVDLPPLAALTLLAEGRPVLLRDARLVAARALLGLDRGAEAAPLARTVLGQDPLDEEAARVVMAAQASSGSVSDALRTFATLRRKLREELGADPAPATASLHAALLRGDWRAQPGAAAPGKSRPGPAAARGSALVGRDAEVVRLGQRWAEAAGGRGGLVLIAGEAGVGKTALARQQADAARRTGGLVLEARCYEAERSRLLQPLAEALAVAGRTMHPDALRTAAAGHEDALARLVPSLAQLFPGDQSPPIGRRSPDAELRAVFEAVTGFVDRLSRQQPALLLLDDLQNAAPVTVEAVHALTRVATHGALLVVATIRPTEGAPALRLLEEAATRLDLGPLDAAAVAALAADAGHEERADEIAGRTGGHALFVVEILRDLAAGGDGRPASLQTSVLTRLERCGPTVSAVLRSGAVLGSAFDPLLAAEMAGTSAAEALAACEVALSDRLLVARADRYEFANDLIRDAIHDGVPEPSRIAQHRLAADLLVEEPEAVAVHAEAAGQWRRACLSWLLAAESALARFASADAEALADQALSLATQLDEPELLGRAFLARGHARDARSAHEQALDDCHEAVAAARRAGDLRLEMTALRAASGDVTVTVVDDVADIERPLLRMLDIARSLGDASAEADALTRLTVLSTARLDFVRAEEFTRRAEAVAAASNDPLATTNALDARKHVAAYQGLVGDLAEVIDPLEPALRRGGDLWSLQWTVFESSFVPLAAGDHAAALARMTEALEINRRSGYVASESWHLAHLGWVHRLAGDLPTALALGRKALDLSRRHGRHRWWLSTAAGHYAGSLLAAGLRAEAVDVLDPLRPTGPPVGDEAYRLRMAAPLARATGADADLRSADALFSGLRTAPGRAWLLGADVYLALGRAWLAHGDAERARQVLEPFASAAETCGWPAFAREARHVLKDT
jgi:DNA-binding SARP family transcriptional activator/tetratricopeptide (TPR) repeat protein